MPRFGLRTSFPLFMLGGFVLAVAASLAVSLESARDRLVIEKTEELRRDSAFLARMAERHLATDPAILQSEVMFHAAEEDEKTTAIIAPDGSILYAGRSEWQGRPAVEVLPGFEDSRRQRLIKTAGLEVVQSGDRLAAYLPWRYPAGQGAIAGLDNGLVYIADDLSDAMDAALHEAIVQRVPDLLVILALLPLMIWWIDRMALRPLAELATQTQRLAVGEAARVDPAGTRELVALGEGFNAMSERIHEARTRIEEERLIFSGGPVVAFIWRPESGWPVDYVSPNVIDVMGYSLDEMKARDFRFSQIVHPDDLPRVGEEVQRYLAEGRMAYEQHYRVRHRDGSWHWYYDYTIQITHEDGRVELRGYLIDRSEQYELEERQRLLERGFESMGEGMMITDAEGRILAVNPAFTRITGYAAGEVIGSTPSLLASGRHESGFYEAMWRQLRENGEWRGEVWDRRKDGEEYLQAMTISAIRGASGRITNFIASLSDTTALRKAEENAEWLSGHDPLTGLPNRMLFLDRLSRSLEAALHNRHAGSVLIIDVVRFKTINEARGIPVGDQVLCLLAERIKAELREGETLSRLGGDEFAILLPHLFSDRELAAHQALTLATRLQSIMADPLPLEGEALGVEIAIGMALFPDSDLDEAADVMTRADLALVRAKTETARRVMLYEAAMSEAVHRRFRLEKDLHRAAANGEFRIYLQPQRDRLRRILGFEALVRWQHPKEGLLTPAAFIPLAEETGLIGLVDDWMLAKACRLLVAGEREGRPMTLAVNLSPWHFRQGDIVGTVRSRLADSGARPGRLILEITENLMIDDPETVAAQLRALADLGVRIAIDDFGTGYSSLAWVQRLPIHEIKIDSAFVAPVLVDASAVALVKAMLDMASGLGLAVVAEGVEIEDQAEFLDEQADLLQQGYFHGRPRPAEEWLAELVSGEGLR